MSRPIAIPDDLNAFLAAAGQIYLRPLYALAAAESLTDEVATQLAIEAGLEKADANRLVTALHFSDFVIERNSEWNLTAQSRGYLSERLIEQREFCSSIHAFLYEISTTGDPTCAGDTIPRYLLSNVGKAYHKSPTSPSDGLKLYAAAADLELTGTQWLLGKLAIEQQEQGILPNNAVEPPFLRGMTLYREKRISEAEGYLERVTKSDEVREEVAIACHLVGKIKSRKPGMQVEAEELLRRSLLIGENLRNKNHMAQVLFTLGKLIWDKNRPEAEQMIERSIELNRLTKNYWALNMVQKELSRRRAG